MGKVLSTVSLPVIENIGLFKAYSLVWIMLRGGKTRN